MLNLASQPAVGPLLQSLQLLAQSASASLDHNTLGVGRVMWSEIGQGEHCLCSKDCVRGWRRKKQYQLRPRLQMGHQPAWMVTSQALLNQERPGLTQKDFTALIQVGDIRLAGHHNPDWRDTHHDAQRMFSN